jgi:hypothetical protein
MYNGTLYLILNIYIYIVDINERKIEISFRIRLQRIT